MWIWVLTARWLFLLAAAAALGRFLLIDRSWPALAAFAAAGLTWYALSRAKARSLDGAVPVRSRPWND